MKWFHFILSHSIFISICAAALCFQTYLLMDLAPDLITIALIFFSTLCSYNFYWLISKYKFRKDNDLRKFLLRNFSNVIIFFIAAVAMLAGLYFQYHLIPVVIIAVLLTLLYSLPLWPFPGLVFLRRLGFMKTLLLAFTWSFVTIVIPLQPWLTDVPREAATLFAARFSFMLMLCTIFDSRDIAVDKIRALRSLATDVSRRTLQVIMMFAFALYIIAGTLLRVHTQNEQHVVAFAITGAIVLTVYFTSLRKRGYFFYYFLVDGLMLFSAAATYVASI